MWCEFLPEPFLQLPGGDVDLITGGGVGAAGFDLGVFASCMAEHTKQGVMSNSPANSIPVHSSFGLSRCSCIYGLKLLIGMVSKMPWTHAEITNYQL